MQSLRGMFLRLLLLPSIYAWHGTSLPAHSSPRRASTPLALAEASIVAGAIVEFTNSKGSVLLGTVDEPDGKKKWKVVTSGGNTVSVAPKQVRLVVESTPSKTMTPASLERAAEECSAAVDELYEMVADEGELPLADLSELLLGGASTEERFATYRLLAASFFFRAGPKASAGSSSFMARPADEVENLKSQAESAAQAEREIAEFRTRIAKVASERDGPPLDLSSESESVREEFDALASFGCRAGSRESDAKSENAAADALAKGLLQRLGRKATAEGARQLMVQCGLWSVHENLELIRLEASGYWPTTRSLITKLPSTAECRRCY